MGWTIDIWIVPNVRISIIEPRVNLCGFLNKHYSKGKGHVRALRQGNDAEVLETGLVYRLLGAFLFLLRNIIWVVPKAKPLCDHGTEKHLVQGPQTRHWQEEVMVRLFPGASGRCVSR